MQVLRQTLHWFAPDDPATWSDVATPVFLCFHGPGVKDMFYGFPAAPGGEPGAKVATEQYEVETLPGNMAEVVSDADTEAMFRDHVAGRLRGVSDRRGAAKACLYTYNRTDDGRFRIGAHPQVPAALVVSACSGHGFKHSAGLGEAVVQTLLGEPALCDLSVFAPRP
jgi:sarcosine oxidase